MRKEREDIRAMLKALADGDGITFEPTERGLTNCEHRAAAAVIECMELGYSISDIFYAFIGCALEAAPDDACDFAREAFNESVNERFLDPETLRQVALALNADESQRH